MTDDIQRDRVLFARVLASRAAWTVAGGAVLAGLLGVAGVVAWLYQLASEQPLELLDNGTWLQAGFVCSVLWRLVLLVTMSTGALWSRARAAGDEIGAARLAGRVLERGWLLLKVASFWALATGVLSRIGARWRRLRWLTRLARLRTGSGSIAAVAAVARRERPTSAAEARMLGRVMVGGTLRVAITALVAVLTALPIAAALAYSSGQLDGRAALIAGVAVVPALLSGAGLAAGALLWNQADRRGERRARRQGQA